MQETRVQSLGWEDPLEKEMTTHFGIWPMGSKVGHDIVIKPPSIPRPKEPKHGKALCHSQVEHLYCWVSVSFQIVSVSAEVSGSHGSLPQVVGGMGETLLHTGVSLELSSSAPAARTCL